MIRNLQRLVFLIALATAVSIHAVGPLAKDVPSLDTYTVGGMTSCTASRCTKCGFTTDGTATTCTLVTASSSCECTYTTTRCTGTGTCTYRA